MRLFVDQKKEERRQELRNVGDGREEYKAYDQSVSLYIIKISLMTSCAEKKYGLHEMVKRYNRRM